MLMLPYILLNWKQIFRVWQSSCKIKLDKDISNLQKVEGENLNKAYFLRTRESLFYFYSIRIIIELAFFLFTSSLSDFDLLKKKWDDGRTTFLSLIQPVEYFLLHLCEHLSLLCYLEVVVPLNFLITFLFRHKILKISKLCNSVENSEDWCILSLKDWKFARLHQTLYNQIGSPFSII